jgi:DNA-binding response OmpR family regulator
MAIILLVEDEASIRRLYAFELKERGHEVLCASNGIDAIEMAKQHSPDLVIMDLNLPEKMDGMESMSRILGENADTPIIINTGYSEYKDDFMSWAAEAYVLKSADIDPLMEAVEDVLARRRSQDNG